jgi:hypothetical protein
MIKAIVQAPFICILELEKLQTRSYRHPIDRGRYPKVVSSLIHLDLKRRQGACRHWERKLGRTRTESRGDASSLIGMALPRERDTNPVFCQYAATDLTDR